MDWKLVSSQQLYARSGSASSPPLLVDVRREDGFGSTRSSTPLLAGGDMRRAWLQTGTVRFGRLVLRFVLGIVPLLAATAPVRAAEIIRVYSGGAPRAAMKLFAPDFEQTTGHKLAFTFDGVSGIRDRLASGEKADVILLPTPMIDAMNQAGALRSDSRTVLARSGIGVVVRQSANAPDISTPEAVRQMLLNARSIAYSDPKLAPSGIHLTRVLAQLGITDAVREKTILRTPFDGGVELVANGDAEVGMFLASEIQMVKDVRLVGLFPAELQSYVEYAGAVTTDSPSPEASLEFIRFLSSSAKWDHWKAVGFEPGAGVK